MRKKCKNIKQLGHHLACKIQLYNSLLYTQLVIVCDNASFNETKCIEGRGESNLSFRVVSSDPESQVRQILAHIEGIDHLTVAHAGILYRASNLRLRGLSSQRKIVTASAQPKSIPSVCLRLCPTVLKLTVKWLAYLTSSIALISCHRSQHIQFAFLNSRVLTAMSFLFYRYLIPTIIFLFVHLLFII